MIQKRIVPGCAMEFARNSKLEDFDGLLSCKIAICIEFPVMWFHFLAKQSTVICCVSM